MDHITKRTVLIIGAGQVGGSMALALKDNAAFDVMLFDSSEQVIDFWRQSPALNNSSVHVATHLTTAAAQADVVIIATPISAFANVIQSIAPHLRTGTIISDTGSAKMKSIAQIHQTLTARDRAHDVLYFPAHPGTGAEHHGPQSARADMYHCKPFFIMPPLANAGPQERTAFAKHKEFWQLITLDPPSKSMRRAMICSSAPLRILNMWRCSR